MSGPRTAPIETLSSGKPYSAPENQIEYVAGALEVDTVRYAIRFAPI